MGFAIKLLPQCLRIRLVVFKSRLKELFPLSEREIREMKVEFADWEEAALSDQDAWVEKSERRGLKREV